ncbi:MAG: helix-turn-helix domain-containing protein [Clostridia bacterium]|nr:helix-turn-helix domain-containing protein [Clostridia bacterium]
MLNIVGIKLYDVGEVADMFKVNKTTIRSWIKNGTLETIRINRIYYINEDTLRRLVTPQTKQDTDV